MGRHTNRKGSRDRRHLIDAHEGGHMRGLEEGEQAVGGDKVEDIGLLQSQEDGEGQVEAPLQLVQVCCRLQQSLAVAARPTRPAT